MSKKEDVQETPEATESNQRPVFRNSSNRIYHLKRRPHQAESEAYFQVGPGDTVQPLDDQEQKLLTSIDEFRDVGKEAPALGNAMDSLKKQLADAAAENAALKKDREDLKAQVEDLQDGKKGRK